MSRVLARVRGEIASLLTLSSRPSGARGGISYHLADLVSLWCEIPRQARNDKKIQGLLRRALSCSPRNDSE